MQLLLYQYPYSHELGIYTASHKMGAIIIRMRETEKVLKALANRRRLTILHLLKKNERLSVGEVAKEIKLSFKATSRHLSVLSAADIVDREQEGTTVWYFLKNRAHPLVHAALSRFST